MVSEAAAYGERHARVYDRLYGALFSPDAAVRALREAAAGGPVLELGVGTGRLAIPLAGLGLTVDGIEASPAMIAELRTRPGGERVGVIQADLASFALPRRDYAVAVCAVSTLFMLNHRQQQGCLAAVARHLRPGGQLFVEAFVPDPSRFDHAGRRSENRPAAEGHTHLVESRHDPAARTVTIIHTLTDPGGTSSYPVTLTYVSLAGMDEMAAAAGLRFLDRWNDWTHASATPDSRDPISVYAR